MIRDVPTPVLIDQYRRRQRKRRALPRLTPLGRLAVAFVLAVAIIAAIAAAERAGRREAVSSSFPPNAGLRLLRLENEHRHNTETLLRLYIELKNRVAELERRTPTPLLPDPRFNP